MLIKEVGIIKRLLWIVWISCYLGLSKLLRQNTTGWVAFKQQECISHGSGGCKSKTKVPADSGSGEDTESGS